MSDKYYGPDPTVFKVITEADHFTDALQIRTLGNVVIEDTASMNMTVHLQVRPNKSSGWVDTGDEYTGEGAWPLPYGGGHEYRLGVPSGSYTSGSCKATLSGRNKL